MSVLRFCLPAPKLRRALALILCIPVVSIYFIGQRQQWVEDLTRSGPKCVGWKATVACLPNGSCNQEVHGTSGYCVCEGSVTVPHILNISRDKLPAGTFESGQMLVDKSRHWRGLLVAAYMNAFGGLFFELLTSYLGKASRIMCRRRFLGNTMVQHDPDEAAVVWRIGGPEVAGWLGTYEPTMEPQLNSGDRMVGWYFRQVRWRIRPWERRLCRWRRKLPKFLRCKEPRPVVVAAP
ncbi:hypothetical protein TSOC_004254 [Tetrabaena socialis]|uniref:Uncharacterized protein n=1 Tax=Tetrabaena socialis TaxID=47790 RepID=A0A2J8A9D7_9CHLO|nr:hypothetical protein TSOC_004254 [Tetrabaena socialis]|eukprot:PNH09136.1 hypothetical protein TSOC_004254 [Tetrabaena socialis]